MSRPPKLKAFRQIAVFSPHPHPSLLDNPLAPLLRTAAGTRPRKRARGTTRRPRRRGAPSYARVCECKIVGRGPASANFSALLTLHVSSFSFSLSLFFFAFKCVSPLGKNINASIRLLALLSVSSLIKPNHGRRFRIGLVRFGPGRTRTLDPTATFFAPPPKYCISFTFTFSSARIGSITAVLVDSLLFDPR